VEKIPFDRQVTKEFFLKRWSGRNLDLRTVELIMLRAEFMVRNQGFVNEVKKLQEEKERGSKEYRSHRDSICKKWNITNYLIYNIVGEPDRVVWSQREGFIDYIGAYRFVFVVDFRYPKSKIIDKFKAELNEAYDHFWEKVDWKAYYPKQIQEIKQPLKRQSGNIPSDLEDYDNYLKVWDLKRLENKTWKQVRETLDISLDTARNWCKRADELIRCGMPGFAPFPK